MSHTNETANNETVLTYDPTPVTNSVFIEEVIKHMSHIEAGYNGLKRTIERHIGTPVIFEIKEKAKQVY